MLSSPAHSKAFSLVELLLSTAIGLACFGIITSLVFSGLVIDAQNMRVIRLSDEIVSLSQLMRHELNRAGYASNAPQYLEGNINGCTTPLHCAPIEFRQLLFTRYDENEADNSCVVFAYDRDKSGTLTNNNAMGFRLRDNAIEIRRGQFSCTSGGWVDITDTRFVIITDLVFGLLEPAFSEACLSTSHSLNCIPSINSIAKWIITISYSATLVEPQCEPLVTPPDPDCLTLSTNESVFVANVSYQ